MVTTSTLTGAIIPTVRAGLRSPSALSRQVCAQYALSPDNQRLDETWWQRDTRLSTGARGTRSPPSSAWPRAQRSGWPGDTAPAATSASSRHAKRPAVGATQLVSDEPSRTSNSTAEIQLRDAARNAGLTRQGENFFGAHKALLLDELAGAYAETRDRSRAWTKGARTSCSAGVLRLDNDDVPPQRVVSRRTDLSTPEKCVRRSVRDDQRDGDFGAAGCAYLVGSRRTIVPTRSPRSAGPRSSGFKPLMTWN